MPEHKYTAGPWLSRSCGIDGFELAIASQWHGDACTAVKPFGMFKTQLRDINRAKADANLIAAAPDLLEALEGLLRQVEAYDLPLSDPERIAARAAIAKALGQA